MFDTSLLPVYSKIYAGIPNKILCKPINVVPVLYYDQFVSNGYEYIILPFTSINSNTKKVLVENEFNIAINPIRFTQPSFIAYRETELLDTYQHKHDIVMCVYFLQNKNEEIERFFDYYLDQGVEKIFMYYCGKLSDRPNLPQRNEVEYLEWNYIHYLHDLYENEKKIHYSQIPLYNTFAKKISPHCKWSFFVDLDEYVKAPTNLTLKDYLLTNEFNSHLFTQHRWAKINFDKNEVKFEKIPSNLGRGKTILNGKLIQPSTLMINHRSANAANSNLLMFHTKKCPSNNLDTCNLFS